MRDKLKEKETDKIIKYAFENSDMTVEEIADNFKITHNLAFYIICEAGKKLKKMNTPKTISEVEKEFDEVIKDLAGTALYSGDGNDIDCEVKKVKNFIRQSINEILDSIPLEEEKAKLGSENQDEYVAYTNGYNQAAKEIKEWKENIIK